MVLSTCNLFPVILSAQQRYDRQTQFAPIGVAGQQRLLASDVAVLGCGALGTVAAEILTRSGIGRIRLIDRDVVEWSNLQRQALYDEHDAREGHAKADAASIFPCLESVHGILLLVTTHPG